MSVTFKVNQVLFKEQVGVEEAETLLSWLQDQEGTLEGIDMDMSECEYLHPACLQVLMACEAKVSAWPENESLSGWLKTALKSSSESRAQ